MEDSTDDNDFAVFWNPGCQLHDVPGILESPQRTNAISSMLEERLPQNAFRLGRSAKDRHFVLFHSNVHHRAIMKKCERAEVLNEEVELQKDVVIMKDSKEAVYYATGAVISAIDNVFLPRDDPQRIQTAFCNIRPPGHHAFPQRSTGFCLFNNVGIAAMYAMKKYYIDRVAILDFDAHHGNGKHNTSHYAHFVSHNIFLLIGTEKGFATDERVFYASTHHRDGYPKNSGKPLDASNCHHERIINCYVEKDCTNTEFLAIWQNILKQMILFKPQLILLSAGKFTINFHINTHSY